MASVKTPASLVGKKYDGMMRRCYNPKDPSYKNYGAKGVRVCEAWIRDIEEFRRWFFNELKKIGGTEVTLMNCPKRFQVDRIDGSGHYTPENCRIATGQENVRNRLGIRRRFETAEGTVIEV